MPPSGARDAISGIVALRRVVVRVRSVRSFLRSFFPPFAVNEALPKHVVDDAAADGREGHPGNLGGDSSRQKNSIFGARTISALPTTSGTVISNLRLFPLNPTDEASFLEEKPTLDSEPTADKNA